MIHYYLSLAGGCINIVATEMALEGGCYASQVFQLLGIRSEYGSSLERVGIASGE